MSYLSRRRTAILALVAVVVSALFPTVCPVAPRYDHPFGLTVAAAVQGTVLPSVSPSRRTVQLLPNGGFERGVLAPWRSGGSLPPRVVSRLAHRGRYVALVGRLDAGVAGTDAPVSSTLTVSVAIPMSATTVGISLFARRLCGLRGAASSIPGSPRGEPRGTLALSVRLIAPAAPRVARAARVSRPARPVRRSRPAPRALLSGCGRDAAWLHVALALDGSHVRGGVGGQTMVIAATVAPAAGGIAALLLDDVSVTATLPTARATPVATVPPTMIPTATSTATVTPDAMATETETETATTPATMAVTATALATAATTATATLTAAIPPSVTAPLTATPTDVPNICADPAVVAAYLTALPTMSPTPQPPTATATPAAGTATPTITPPGRDLKHKRSNIPTPPPADTATSGPTPGYTPTPGPSPTVGTACHPVLKGILLGFVARDGGASSAATPVAGPDDARDLLASGARTVRIDFHLVHDDSWTPAEFGAYDVAVDAYCQQHVDILGLLGANLVSPVSNPNEWVANSAERGGGNGDNDFMRRYAARAVEVVGHYRGCVHSWELWNEPNVGRDEYGGAYLYPSNFAALLADTYTALKGAYPEVTIVSGGIFGNDNGGLSNPGTTGADYLRQTYVMGLQVTHTWDPVRAQFGGNPLDAVGQHLYLDQGSLVYTRHIVDAYRWMHDAYAAFGDGSKPIFMTEGAWSTNRVGADQQALNLDMLYAISRNPALPYVARVYWFTLRDDPTTGYNCGLTNPDGSPKPALARFQAVAE